jgi:ComF family protein
MRSSGSDIPNGTVILPVRRGGSKLGVMLASAPAVARAALRGMLDFALPPRCPGCGEIVGEPHRFCLDCWASLTFLGDPCCARCGLPFAYGGEGADAECGGCLAEPPPFDRARGAVAYGDVSRQVALRLKYSGRPGLAETLARFMLRHVGTGEAGEGLLVPVPLHRWRIWKRGYNQAALIASALARHAGLACELDLLRRTRATPPLRGLGRKERALAVRGAFRLAEGAKERIEGRTIILVDDVFTSGATASACARVLKRGGAARVELLCWARVVREGGEAA